VTRAHYGDAESELRATLEGCALGDRHDLARAAGTGPDLLDLIQRLGTGDVAGLASGQGRTTVLTTNKGRIVERLFVSHLGEQVVMIGGAGDATRLLEHIKRFTFAEKTGLADAGDHTCLYTLTGPRAGEALEGAGLRPPGPLGSTQGQLAGSEVHVLGHDGVSLDGFAVLTKAGDPRVWTALKEAVEAVGGRPAGARALEASRIIRGLPAAGFELTEDYNPLEAGLREAVSFDKGCYVGQEVVARLQTYDKVSRALWALRLPPGVAEPESGTPLFAGGRQVGRITSSVIPPGWPHAVALAYVKHKHVDEGAPLEVGAAGAALLACPASPPIPMEET
jgi:folate-binding protein YgfZ